MVVSSRVTPGVVRTGSDKKVPAKAETEGVFFGHAT